MISPDFNYLLMMLGILMVIIDILFDAKHGIGFMMTGIMVMVGSLVGIMFSSFSTSVVVFLTILVVYFFLVKKHLERKLAGL